MQLLAEHEHLTDEMKRLQPDGKTATTVSKDLSSAAEGLERPAKRIKLAHWCEVSSRTPSTTAYLALVAKPDKF